jgi:hypothetical protein
MVRFRLGTCGAYEPVLDTVKSMPPSASCSMFFGSLPSWLQQNTCTL